MLLNKFDANEKKIQAIEFIPSLLKILADNLEKNNFLSLAKTCHSVNKSISRDQISFLNVQEIYRQIFSDQVICSIVKTSKKNSLLIQNDPILSNRLIQAKIVRKMIMHTDDDEYDELNLYTFFVKINLFKSLAIKQIKMDSKDYVHTYNQAVAFYKKENEIFEGELTGHDELLFRKLVKVLSSINTAEAIELIDNDPKKINRTFFYNKILKPNKKNLFSVKKILDKYLEIFENLLLKDLNIDTWKTWNNLELSNDLYGVLDKITSYSEEKGLETYERILKKLQTCTDYPNHEHRESQIDLLCRKANIKVQYGKKNEALEIIKNVIKLLSNFEKKESIDYELKLIFKTLSSFNSEEAIKLSLLYINDPIYEELIKIVVENLGFSNPSELAKAPLYIKNQEILDEISEKVAKISCALLIENHLKARREDPSDLFWADFKEFNETVAHSSPYLAAELYLSIYTSFEDSIQSLQDPWLKIKNNALFKANFNSTQCEDPFEKCFMMLSVAEQMDSFIVKDALIYTIKCLANNEVEDPVEKATLWQLMYKLKNQFKLTDIGDFQDMLFKAINEIEDQEEKLDAILKFASLTKKQEIFDLAIKTAISFKAHLRPRWETWDDDIKVMGRAAYRASRLLKSPQFYLAKIANTDLEQTPLILSHIQQHQWPIYLKDQKIEQIRYLIEIFFLEELEFKHVSSLGHR